MTKKSHTIKKKDESKNQTWGWEETPEVIAALEQLHKSSEAVKGVETPKNLHIPNQNFAPQKNKDAICDI